MLNKIQKIGSGLIGGLFLMFLKTRSALAQMEYAPPSLLPGDNQVTGGYGGECAGLTDAIKQGNLHLNQIPCFFKYFAETLIGLAGTLAVIFVLIGGYKYVFGGDEKKDDAKHTITFALTGLAVTLLAWIITDVVLRFVTE